MEKVESNCEQVSDQNDLDTEDMKDETNSEKIESVADESQVEPKDDVYSYTKRGEFTSETFKIEVRNLPKHIGYDTFRKLMKRLDLKPLKMKLIGRPGAPSHAFITFRCDEDRDLAINKLNNYLWKSKELCVRKANPIADPLIEKRNSYKSEPNSDDRPDSKRIKIDHNNQLTETDLGNVINDQVVSLWKMPYTQQVVKKKQLLQQFLIKLCKEIGKIVEDLDEESNELSVWFHNVRKTCDNKCCDLEEVRASPIVDGYRNKCEFTVGIDKTVGFRLGLYKEGSMKVICPPPNCPIISDQMRKALNAFQTYIRDESSLNGFNPETHSGHWRQATVRATQNDCMIIMALHPQTLTEDEINEEKKKICHFFETNPEFGVTSVYIHISSKRHEVCKSYLEHLFGEQTVSETIRMDPSSDESLQFRISPLAFFQINTTAAEICYQTIADLVKVSPELTVLDICCGTGTIGLCLANKVKKVIGIELNADAIEDAKFNAELNSISNVEFIQGKAEDVISNVLESCDSELVAIIDPPRAGLNNSVIKALRSNVLLKRLVYVSCDPTIAKKNLIDLCRPKSKTYKGEPFVPIKAVPVDMFPHTNRCELVLLYERLANG